MRKRSAFAIAIATALLSLGLSVTSSVAAADEGVCVVYNPFHDGRSVSEHISRETSLEDPSYAWDGSRDGLGMHSIVPGGLPGIDVGRPEIPDTEDAVYSPFVGAITHSGWDNSGGGWFVRIAGVGDCEGVAFWALHSTRSSDDYIPTLEVTPETVVCSPGTSGFYTDINGDQIKGATKYDPHCHLILEYERSELVPQGVPSVQASYFGKAEAWFVNLRNVVSDKPGQPAYTEAADNQTAIEVPWTEWEKELLNQKTMRAATAASILIVGALSVFSLLQAVVGLARSGGPRAAVRNAGSFLKVFFLAVSFFFAAVALVGFTKGRLVQTQRVATLPTTVATTSQFEAAARYAEYGDSALLRAFYEVAVPRGADGRPSPDPNEGVVFPPSAAAAVVAGETVTDAAENIDPTQPSKYGYHLAWWAVERRWPPSDYERWVLGLTVSRAAQQQRAGLTAIAVELGTSPRKIYGSSAGAVGRTQILPSYLAPGGLCDDVAKDVWNDRRAIAECTTRHLMSRGCWGGWAQTGDVWSSFCSYNPSAWGDPQASWYWEVLDGTMKRLQEAERRFDLTATTASVVAAGLTSAETGASAIPIPIAGMEIAKEAMVLQQTGEMSTRLLTGTSAERRLVELAAYELTEGDVVAWYRFFRIWTAIFFTPEELASMGVTP